MADVDVEEQLSRIGLAVIGLSLGFLAGRAAILLLWHPHNTATRPRYRLQSGVVAVRFATATYQSINVLTAAQRGASTQSAAKKGT